MFVCIVDPVIGPRKYSKSFSIQCDEIKMNENHSQRKPLSYSWLYFMCGVERIINRWKTKRKHFVRFGCWQACRKSQMEGEKTARFVSVLGALFCICECVCKPSNRNKNIIVRISYQLTIYNKLYGKTIKYFSCFPFSFRFLNPSANAGREWFLFGILAINMFLPSFLSYFCLISSHNRPSRTHPLSLSLFYFQGQ